MTFCVCVLYISPADPPDEIKSVKSERPSSSGGLAEVQKGRDEAENLRAESTENRESEEEGEE